MLRITVKGRPVYRRWVSINLLSRRVLKKLRKEKSAPNDTTLAFRKKASNECI